MARNISLAQRSRVATREESIRSFKPKPLRYTKGMAEKACHTFGSTTRFGLTQASGPRRGTHGPAEAGLPNSDPRCCGSSAEGSWVRLRRQSYFPSFRSGHEVRSDRQFSAGRALHE